MESRERENVLADLAHADEEVRRLAVERLTTLPPAEAIPLLVATLGDPSWRVRKAVIERLAASRELARAARALVEALGDGDNPGRRNAALEALVHAGVAVVPVLLEATAADDVDVRKQVVDALAGIGDPSARQRLLELLGDPDANVRAAAADAIGAISEAGGAEAEADGVGPLLECVDTDAEPLVRLSAMRALTRIEADLPIAAVATALDDPLLRRASLAALAHSSDPAALETLLKALEAGARSTREAAVEALLSQASRGTPEQAERFAEQLRRAWNSPQRFLKDAAARLVDAPLSTRLALAQFFGLLRLPEVVLPLLEAGVDEALAEVVLGVLAGYGSVAEAEIVAHFEDLGLPAKALACEVLGRTDGDDGDGLLRAALAAAEPALHIAAIRAVGARGRSETLPDLVACLERLAGGDAEIEEEEQGACVADAIVAVAEAAGGDAAERAVALVVERLVGANEGFRFAATDVLGRVGRPKDAPSIELLLSDPSDRVRRAATAALARVAPDASEPLRLAMADESASVRIGAAAALARSSRADAVADFAHLAEDEDPRVRAAAMRAAGVWARARQEDADSERILSLLAVGLRRGGAVAMASLESLAVLGGAGVVPLARTALEDPDSEIVQTALTCIVEHGSPADLDEAITMLAHEGWTVRAHAVKLLREARCVRAIPAMLRRLELERDEFVRDALLRAVEALESQAG